MYDKIIKFFIFIIGAESILVIIGWVFNLDFLTRILPKGINMSFPTALMFFLSVFIIYLLYRVKRKTQNYYELPHLIISGIIFIIFLINITILIGVFMGMQTGMENLFIQNQQNELINITTVAKSPAISTMICFVLFGIASIFSLFYGKYFKIIKFFGYLISIIGLIATLGYICRVSLLYYQLNDSIIPMALNTAISFILLGFCLTILNSNKSINES
ncbi:MAG: hypothetical protein WAV10_01490 [Minisyncoccia bacterium]